MNNLVKLLKTHEELESRIRREVYSEVEIKARTIMRKHPRCAKFCMAMGYATFYDKKGDSISPDWGYLPYPKYLKDFDNWLDEFGDFKITGMPMKIKGANGELITDW
jgi:hypothetical protein